MRKTLKLLWQSVKLLLRIYNLSQPADSLEIMTQILQLFQEIKELLNTLKDKDLCKDIYWELGVFKQKMYAIIDRCKGAVQHINLKLTYFGSQSSEESLASSPVLAPSPRETPPSDLDASPVCGLVPRSHSLAADQALGTCVEVDSCGECQTLRQQLFLAERLTFVAGEIQNSVAKTSMDLC
ncbi:agnoprotein [Rhinolophus affinis polyomavirus 4]|nr:agnoprotein [Rhinolophus affinis polyomavirus 4]BBG62135.1 agnoprotein [Rhinolophus affinis polyomavirus 4]BBG62141.1 agnoprotein [Rhinolophus affinis polyomavirus 4]